MKASRRKIEELLWITGLHRAARSVYRISAGRGRTEQRELITRFYRQFVMPGNLVFDIGANVGMMSEVFCSLGARIVAVEPNTDCVRHIQLSYGSLGVETIQAVAGPQNGLAVIHISDQRDDISSLSRGWMEAIQREHKEYSGLWTRETTLPMITLDALIAHYGQPEFIKVDVEGFDQKF